MCPKLWAGLQEDICPGPGWGGVPSLAWASQAAGAVQGLVCQGILGEENG